MASSRPRESARRGPGEARCQGRPTVRALCENLARDPLRGGGARAGPNRKTNIATWAPEPIRSSRHRLELLLVRGAFGRAALA
eukprot:7339935-Pyramimonas_sp.AAC.2